VLAETALPFAPPAIGAEEIAEVVETLESGWLHGVFTTPLTFCATANVVIHTGATPVFADIDPETFNLDALAAHVAITPRTRAMRGLSTTHSRSRTPPPSLLPGAVWSSAGHVPGRGSRLRFHAVAAAISCHGT
jgi:hypothetical protein